jgi:outer membrane protein TolC
LAEASFADVMVKAAQIGAAGAQLRATRLDLRPDFLLGMGIGFRGDFDPVASFRFGIELPIWQGRKQRPLIRAAEAELVRAQEEARDARAIARTMAVSLQAEWQRADEQVLRYTESFVPQTSLAFNAARLAYLGRRGDFSTVIEDFSLWLEARRGLAEREAERHVAWAAIQALFQPAPSDAPTQSEGDRR